MALTRSSVPSPSVHQFEQQVRGTAPFAKRRICLFLVYFWRGALDTGATILEHGCRCVSDGGAASRTWARLGAPTSSSPRAGAGMAASSKLASTDACVTRVLTTSPPFSVQNQRSQTPTQHHEAVRRALRTSHSRLIQLPLACARRRTRVQPPATPAGRSGTSAHRPAPGSGGRPRRLRPRARQAQARAGGQRARAPSRPARVVGRPAPPARRRDAGLLRRAERGGGLVERPADPGVDAGAPKLSRVPSPPTATIAALRTRARMRSIALAT